MSRLLDINSYQIEQQPHPLQDLGQNVMRFGQFAHQLSQDKKQNARADDANQRAEEKQDWMRSQYEHEQKQRGIAEELERADALQAHWRIRNMRTGGRDAITRASMGQVSPGAVPDNSGALEDTQGLIDRGVDPDAAGAFGERYNAWKIVQQRYQEAVQEVQFAVEDGALSPEQAQEILGDLDNATKPEVSPDAVLTMIREERRGIDTARAAQLVYQDTYERMQGMLGEQMPPPWLDISPREWQARRAHARRSAEMYQSVWRRIAPEDAIGEVEGILYGEPKQDSFEMRRRALEVVSKWPEWQQGDLTFEDRQAILAEGMQLLGMPSDEAMAKVASYGGPRFDPGPHAIQENFAGQGRQGGGEGAFDYQAMAQVLEDPELGEDEKKARWKQLVQAAGGGWTDQDGDRLAIARQRMAGGEEEAGPDRAQQMIDAYDSRNAPPESWEEVPSRTGASYKRTGGLTPEQKRGDRIRANEPSVGGRPQQWSSSFREGPRPASSQDLALADELGGGPRPTSKTGAPPAKGISNSDFRAAQPDQKRALEHHLSTAKTRNDVKRAFELVGIDPWTMGPNAIKKAVGGDFSVKEIAGWLRMWRGRREK